MKTFDYAGKTWEYHDCCLFLFEIGRYANVYKTHRKFDEPFAAISAYENFNVSDGYKKRLVRVKNGIKTTIAHQTTRRGVK